MVRVAEIFQSGMLLQQEKPVAVWGMADVNAKVTVSIQGRKTETTADNDGKWSLELPPLTAGVGEKMEIRSGSTDIQLIDIAVGEVFVAGGQSNMEFYMRYEKHIADEKPVCANPNLRFYDVPEIAFEGQREAFDYARMGIWRKASAEDVEYFSAVGYYFAKELEKDLNVPVGIIGCNWGGTNASAWMSAQSAERAAAPWVEHVRKKFKSQNYDGMDLETYYAGEEKNPMNDRGNPFANAFTEMMLPRTPSPDEIQEFFSGLPEGEGPDPNKVDPKEIPGSLYEHMVKKIAPYTIRGFLFYQGESDDELGVFQDTYDKRLRAVMTDWRTLWKEQKLPFLIVQLPGWQEWLAIHAQNWQAIRLCQEKVTREDGQAYLCSISDAGEQLDIHPRNKKVVGERLALLARHYIFGEDILCDAPRFEHAIRDGKKIVLNFVNTGTGLSLAGEKVQALTVSQNVESVCVWEKQMEILLSQESWDKVKIEFAMTDWYLVNLYNSAGIPAIPFEVII